MYIDVMLYLVYYHFLGCFFSPEEGEGCEKDFPPNIYRTEHH